MTPSSPSRPPNQAPSGVGAVKGIAHMMSYVTPASLGSRTATTSSRPSSRAGDVDDTAEQLRGDRRGFGDAWTAFGHRSSQSPNSTQSSSSTSRSYPGPICRGSQLGSTWDVAVSSGLAASPSASSDCTASTRVPRRPEWPRPTSLGTTTVHCAVVEAAPIPEASMDFGHTFCVVRLDEVPRQARAPRGRGCR